MLCQAQDMTVRVMTYNLLNFPYVNNDPRVSNFQAIHDYIGADIFILQELKSSSGVNQLISTLNANGSINYDRAPDYYSSGGGLGNMLIFNSDKLGFRYQTEIPSDTRSISHYALYVKDPGLSCHQDTIFIDLFGAHFKASQGGSNENRRLTQTQDMFSLVNSLPSNHNIIVAGDLNFYRAEEPGYEYILDNTHPQTFSDVQGYWERTNFSYSEVYTQSTRSNTHPGGSGGVPGGCDDRFDFIFFSENIIENNEHIEYVNDSYTNIGNDGGHYDVAIIAQPSPPLPDGSLNAEIPDELVYHLFEMSDHLPIIADLAINFPVGGGSADPEFAYTGGLSFCLGAANPTVTHTTGSDGTYSYTGAGTLSLDSNTGAIDLAASTVGTYTITNTVSGCGGADNSSSVTITISEEADAEFSYSGGTAYCLTNPNPTVVHTTGSSGTYSYTSIDGLLTLDPLTGAIDIAASTIGTFEITNSLISVCGSSSSTVTVTISNGANAEFYYPSDVYCIGDDNPEVQHLMGEDGTYFFEITNSEAFLSINNTTGEINLEDSTPGTYTIFNLLNNDCGNAIYETTISIEAPPEASFSFTEGNVFSICNAEGLLVSTTLDGTEYGTFTYTTTGLGTLDLNPNTGQIDVETSTPGTFNVEHQLSNGCGVSMHTETITIEECLQDVLVQVKLFLQGNYDADAGEMNTTLLDNDLLPLQQPYNIAPWNYVGGESVASLSDFPSDAVDWVLIELRDGDDPSISIGQRAGILLMDGTVVAPDGSLLSFSGLATNHTYYFVARHRNHLDVMSNQAVSLPNNSPYNLSILGNVWADSGDAEPVVPLGAGDYGLAAGDYSGDGLILVDDLNGYQMESAKINEYVKGDFNLDRVVTVADFNLYQPNASKVGISLVRY